VFGFDPASISPLVAYGALFALIAIESGGIPLPGESALAGHRLWHRRRHGGRRS
jgi:hypothetical protein